MHIINYKYKRIIHQKNQKMMLKLKVIVVALKVMTQKIINQKIQLYLIMQHVQAVCVGVAQPSAEILFADAITGAGVPPKLVRQFCQ